MPTGYTSVIDDSDGKATFEQYAWRCARAFGAFVQMRDEPMDSPTPTAFEPDPYHAKALKEAEERKARLLKTTDAQADKEAQAEFEAELKRHRESLADWKRSSEAYEEMARKVSAWRPPTPDHIGLKDFMLEQLRTGGPSDPRRYLKEPTRRTAAEWRAAQLTKAERDILYHQEHHAEEVERANKRTAWVQALVESIGKPVGKQEAEE